MKKVIIEKTISIGYINGIKKHTIFIEDKIPKHERKPFSKEDINRVIRARENKTPYKEIQNMLFDHHPLGSIQGIYHKHKKETI